jgi:hypothetical protein
MAESSSRLARAPSVSSAGTASTSGAHSFLPRYTPKPEPSYISASSAADHITHRHHHENYDLLSPAATPTNDGAEFSTSSLALLNSFLDSLLYNFLTKSRSISLPQLRLAILEVLKAKLGREALASADEELEGLVGDIDDEDGADATDFPRRSSTPSLDWHLESAFKRMRLRVMVFIRLGDFDDDDEEKFLEEDASGASPALDHSILSSPAAVYLASVLEYLAEQTLSLTGDAAYARSKSKARRTIRRYSAMDSYDSDNVIVEDVDVEKIALNPSLGRLWRTFRKNQRSIMSPTSPTRADSRRSSVASPTRSAAEFLRRNEYRKSGSNQIMQALESAQEEPHEEDIPDCEPSETDIAANIPLPKTDRDVDEIEIPGLAAVVYDESEERSDDEDMEYEQTTRPRSASFAMPGAFIVDDFAKMESAQFVKTTPTRQRSNSVPSTSGMPWGWIPASVRRALAKLSKMDDVELAAITPLPEDNENDHFDVDEQHDSHAVAANEMGAPEGVETLEDDATSSNVEPSVGPESNGAAVTTASAAKSSHLETSKEVLDSDKLAVSPIEELIVSKKSVTEAKEESSESYKSKTGVFAGATALAAVAAGATVAAIVGSSNKKHAEANPDELSAQHDNEDLSVQTKEVFEPGDDSARPSLEFVPKSILKPARPPPAPRTVDRKPPVAIVTDRDVKKTVRTKPEAVVPKKHVEEFNESGEKQTPLLSVYAPKKSIKEQIQVLETQKGEVVTTEAAVPTGEVEQTKSVEKEEDALVDSTIDEPVSEPKKSYNMEQTATKESKSATLSPVDVKKSTQEVTNSGVDSKMTSPMHISSMAQHSPVDVAQAAQTVADSMSNPVSPVESFDDVPERKESAMVAPADTPPAKEVTTSTPLTAKEGPPKPLASNGNQNVNPYAMLYEDIEPEAIGVAKTSNVPIHSSAPSVTTESRPWTPNRGATRSSSSPQSNANVATNGEPRTRNIPSPLRVGNQEQQSIAQTSQQTVEAPKSTLASDDYDLDKPIDPGRFQSWTRPKESPTIPKFYNQPVGTPTEAQRSGSISQTGGEHSPKGSQSSHKSQNKRASEELKEREFDALLDRKETVKYTLTPEEIRDVGVSHFLYFLCPTIFLLIYIAIFSKNGDR